MNNIKQFVEQNAEAIEGYADMEDEKVLFDTKFRAFAKANKAELGTFLLEAECYDDLLGVIYDSLYNDMEWESFFISHMETMIRTFIQDPEKDEYGVDNFSKLESMGLSKLTDGPFGKKLLNLIMKQIDHSDPYISQKFLALAVDYWIYSIHDQTTIEKLKGKLSDPNWQVRWLAHHGLSYPPLGQNPEEIKIPFTDKVKAFLKNWFGDPTKPERKN